MISLQKLSRSFQYAGEGFHYAFIHDQNLRIHCVAAVVVILLGLYFNLSRFEMIALSLLIMMVFVAELINTAIEKVVDLITLDHHPTAKIAKDVSAAMVLFTAVGALIVGFYIFYPYVLSL